MKRSLLIIVGLLIVLLLIGLWTYLLITHSSPTVPNEPQFGTDVTDPNVGATVPTGVTEPIVAISDTIALQQLTTDPVAGFQSIRIGTSTTGQIYYAQAGTGHVFSINTSSGERTRLSGTTIPFVQRAAITPNGGYIMLKAIRNGETEYIMGTITPNTESLVNFALTDPIFDFTVTDENEFMYAVANAGETIVRVFNPAENTTRTAFSVPLRDITIDWHESTAGPHYVYPRANSRLEGMLYMYTDGAGDRLPVSGYGFSAVGNELAVLSSSIVDRLYTTNLYDPETDQNTLAPLSFIPEKCTFVRGSVNALCGGSFESYPGAMPDPWYRGALQTTDALWEVNAQFGSASLLSNLSDVAGQRIDVVRPTLTESGEVLHFINKSDNTLWQFDTTI